MTSNKRFAYPSVISFFLITICIHASETPKKKCNPYYSPYYARECYNQAAIGSLLNFSGMQLIKEKGLFNKITGRSAITAGLTLYVLTYLKYRRNKEFMKPYLIE